MTNYNKRGERRYDYDLIVKLRNQWLSYKEITQKTGCPSYLITYIIRKYGKIMGRKKSNRKCKLEWCGLPYSANGFCKKHNVSFRHTGKEPLPWLSMETICRVCGKKIKRRTRINLCVKHAHKLCRRKRAGLKFDDLSLSFTDPVTSKLGSNNPRWHGGNSEYPNHCLMKRNRKIKLEQSGGKCEKCGRPANKVHHLDGAKTNHDLSNLLVVCNKCHPGFHDHDLQGNPKFRKIFGVSIMELSRVTGFPYSGLLNYLKNIRA